MTLICLTLCMAELRRRSFSAYSKCRLPKGFSFYFLQIYSLDYNIYMFLCGLLKCFLFKLVCCINQLCCLNLIFDLVCLNFLCLKCNMRNSADSPKVLDMLILILKYIQAFDCVFVQCLLHKYIKLCGISLKKLFYFIKKRIISNTSVLSHE